MGRQVVVALYVLAMVLIVVGVDVLFLRHLFWPRLLANVGIVAVFAAGYFVFLKRSLARPSLPAERAGQGVCDARAAIRAAVGRSGALAVPPRPPVESAAVAQPSAAAAGSARP